MAADQNLVKLLNCIATLLCLVPIIIFLLNILVFYKDKTIKNAINSREIVVKAWLLLPLIFAFAYTITLIRSFKELKIKGYTHYSDYWVIIGFLIGFAFIISIIFITVNSKEGKRHAIAIVGLKILKENEVQGNFTDNHGISNLDYEELLLDNTNFNITVSNNIVSKESTNTFCNDSNEYSISSNNKDGLKRKADDEEYSSSVYRSKRDKDCDDSEINSQEKGMFTYEDNDGFDKDKLNLKFDNSPKIIVEPRCINKEDFINSSLVINEDDTVGEIEDTSSIGTGKNNIVDNTQLLDSKKKSPVRITKQIYYKGADVMPNPFPDEVVKQKLISIKESYLLHCEASDFVNLLNKKKINKKVLFKKEDGTAIVFTKVEYLDFLYFIFGNNLLEHPSNAKIIKWIDKNFDSTNFEGEKIFTKEISDLRNRTKNQILEI